MILWQWLRALASRPIVRKAFLTGAGVLITAAGTAIARKLASLADNDDDDENPIETE